jgi:hypothetical protein
MRPWDEIGDDQRRWTTMGVRDCLKMLQEDGYYLVLDRSWRRFRRLGRVRAERLARRREWKTESGNLLVAQPGDWWVVDESTSADGRRRQWSIGAHEFQQTYAAVPGQPNLFERTGRVDARRAELGERVESREGWEIAQDGDWLVRDTEGNQWFVPGDHFVANYARVGD